MPPVPSTLLCVAMSWYACHPREFNQNSIHQATTHRPDPIRRIRPSGLASDFKDEKRAWLHEGRDLVSVGVEAEGLECVELRRGPDVCVRRGGEEHDSSKERELWHRKERKAPARRREQEEVTVTGSTIPRSCCEIEARCTCQVDMFFSTVLIPSTPASFFFSRSGQTACLEELIFEEALEFYLCPFIIRLGHRTETHLKPTV